jgi:hypothetical protein
MKRAAPPSMVAASPPVPLISSSVSSSISSSAPAPVSSPVLEPPSDEARLRMVLHQGFERQVSRILRLSLGPREDLPALVERIFSEVVARAELARRKRGGLEHLVLSTTIATCLQVGRRRGAQPGEPAAHTGGDGGAVLTRAPIPSASLCPPSGAGDGATRSDPAPLLLWFIEALESFDG